MYSCSLCIDVCNCFSVCYDYNINVCFYLRNEINEMKKKIGLGHLFHGWLNFISMMKKEYLSNTMLHRRILVKELLHFQFDKELRATLKYQCVAICAVRYTLPVCVK